MAFAPLRFSIRILFTRAPTAHADRNSGVPRAQNADAARGKQRNKNKDCAFITISIPDDATTTKHSGDDFRSLSFFPMMLMRRHVRYSMF